MAGNSVWSHIASDAPQLCNGLAIEKSYTEPVTFNILLHGMNHWTTP